MKIDSTVKFTTLPPVLACPVLAVVMVAAAYANLGLRVGLCLRAEGNLF
jgi:hypothetical protein